MGRRIATDLVFVFYDSPQFRSLSGSILICRLAVAHAASASDRKRVTDGDPEASSEDTVDGSRRMGDLVFFAGGAASCAVCQAHKDTLVLVAWENSDICSERGQRVSQCHPARRKKIKEKTRKKRKSKWRYALVPVNFALSWSTP